MVALAANILAPASLTWPQKLRLDQYLFHGCICKSTFIQSLNFANVSLHILKTTSSLKPLRQVLRGMDMKLGNHSLSLSKPAPELGDFIQYASAATELLKSWKNTTGAPKYPLAPTQFFLVLMFRKTPKGFETYAIQGNQLLFSHHFQSAGPFIDVSS